MNDIPLELIQDRRKFIKKSVVGGAMAMAGGAAALANVALPGSASKVKFKAPKPDKIVRSVPENMVWGYFGADVPSNVSINDGDIAQIDTITTAGIDRENPRAFFETHGFPIDQHAKELFDVIEKVKPEPSGIRGHMLTGPVAINGAEPGDSIEIRIMDVKLRSPYGANFVRPGRDYVPQSIKNEQTFIYKYGKTVATCEEIPGLEVPLAPFMGVMAMSPPPETGRVSSIPPAFFGGNLDLRHLIKGTTLHLPVSVAGGMFTTGDAHAAQGNGEVSGTAIETSMSLVAQFIVHKGETLEMPIAETPNHFIAFGLDPDLNKAMYQALSEAVALIHKKLGYTYEQALSICSTAVDFEVTQVVDRTEGVHAMIPKSIFKNQRFDYWYT